MPFDRRFAAEAARAALVMILIPLVAVVGLSRVMGLPVDRADVDRALIWLLFLYVLVMARRYRQRHEHR